MDKMLKSIVQQPTIDYLQLTNGQIETLREIVHSEKNILISGLEEVGKSKFLRYLLSELREDKQHVYLTDHVSRKDVVENITFHPIDYTNIKGQIEDLKVTNPFKPSRGTVIYDELGLKSTESLIEVVGEGSFSNTIAVVLATDTEHAKKRVVEFIVKDKDGSSVLMVDNTVNQFFDHNIHLSKDEEEKAILTIV